MKTMLAVAAVMFIKVPVDNAFTFGTQLRSKRCPARNAKKSSGSRQAELMKALEAAKLAKQQAANEETAKLVEYIGANVESSGSISSSSSRSSTDSGFVVNRTWRGREHGQASYEEFSAAVSGETSTPMADKYRTEVLDSDGSVSAAGLPSLLERNQAVKYLKIGQAAPLEVWNELQDTRAEAASFSRIKEAAGGKDLVIVLTHYQKASGKLNAAVDMGAKQLPRKSFVAHLVVVARDSPAAMGRLAKTCGFPATFLSADGPNGAAWGFSYGVTSQLSEFGISMFAIDALSGGLFAVAYDIDPLQTPEVLRKVAAAHAASRPN